ncbi:hypothetical protein SALBM311S_01527 [Streptomyces alboniger]
MPLSPLEHDRRYGELDQAIRAYVGQPAGDSSDTPGQALTAYLRHTWHTRHWALAVAERLPDEFEDHDTAVADYRTSTDPQLLARLVGELHELLALDLAESDCALAVAELGMEVDAPAPRTPRAAGSPTSLTGSPSRTRSTGRRRPGRSRPDSADAPSHLWRRTQIETKRGQSSGKPARPRTSVSRCGRRATEAGNGERIREQGSEFTALVPFGWASASALHRHRNEPANCGRPSTRRPLLSCFRSMILPSTWGFLGSYHVQ